MKKQIIKCMAGLLIGTATFLGVNYSSREVTISAEKAKVTLLTLGSQAKAYCNEATYWPEVNNGTCSGLANDPNSRCGISTGTSNCTTTQL